MATSTSCLAIDRSKTPSTIDWSMLHARKVDACKRVHMNWIVIWLGFANPCSIASRIISIPVMSRMLPGEHRRIHSEETSGNPETLHESESPCCCTWHPEAAFLNSVRKQLPARNGASTFVFHCKLIRVGRNCRYASDMALGCEHKSLMSQDAGSGEACLEPKRSLE